MHVCLYVMLFVLGSCACCFFFFFNDTATTEIYTLSLHDALPISGPASDGFPPILYSMACHRRGASLVFFRADPSGRTMGDRKSTRLNSSHANISYAVFCLKKKKILPTSMIP